MDRGAALTVAADRPDPLRPDDARGAVSPAAGQQVRRRWLAALACAPLPALEQAWATHGTAAGDPATAGVWLRRPEIGLAMLRGRVGGSGDPFNLGEATVTRCTLQLPDGRLGVGVVLGRELRRAELVARFDAALQDAARQPHLIAAVIAPLEAQQRNRDEAASRAAAATRVEFFTLVRGA